ncbi:MAG: hypothetical protein Q8Q03_00375 [bacterium]|nr:hypothetical protein [bacterium]
MAKEDDVYKFAFIVHPRSRYDIERKFGFFKYVPHPLVNLFTKYFWPITLSKVTGLKSLVGGKDLEGYVISVLLTARQMVENRSLALRRIIQACDLAKKKGVKIIGLGGLTSSFSKGGLDLVDKITVGITTGHAYTSYNVTQNVCALVDYMNLSKKNIKIGIVGAAGSIGSTTAKLLAREGFTNLTLIDLERKKHHFVDMVSDITKINSLVKISLSHQIGDVKTCDIVIAATNAPEALIKSDDLKWGAIVVDDAQPSDVHPDVFLREDVLIIEAGVTHTPGVNSNFNFGLKNKQENFCCLAEVLILAANEWDKHYVINRASLDLVDDIANRGKDLNFKIGQFQNFRGLISSEKLLFVRNCINQNELQS